jgi:beta-glucosidase
MGITTALSPQIDLAPKMESFCGYFWRRPKLATDMARAYVDGFQTSQNRLMRMKDGNQSVNAMIKHWPSDGGRKKEVVMDICLWKICSISGK